MSLEATTGSNWTKLENRTLWQRVHEHLRQEILADRLRPGAELQEVALAESLGVSRGPVREALGRLAAEGLVTVRPRHGAVVRSLSRDEFLEAYQVREALEIAAIRLAVPRLGADELRALEALIAEMGESAERDDIAGFFAANAAFHETLVGASGNRKLRDMHRQLLGEMGRYRLRSLALRGDLKRSIAEHRAILRAVRKGDAARAAHLLSEHIRVPQLRLRSATQEEASA